MENKKQSKSQPKSTDSLFQECCVWMPSCPQIHTQRFRGQWAGPPLADDRSWGGVPRSGARALMEETDPSPSPPCETQGEVCHQKKALTLPGWYPNPDCQPPEQRDINFYCSRDGLPSAVVCDGSPEGLWQSQQECTVQPGIWNLKKFQ